MKKLKREVESGNYCYAGETVTWKDKPDGTKRTKEEKWTLDTIAGPGASEFVKKAIGDATRTGKYQQVVGSVFDIINTVYQSCKKYFLFWELGKQGSNCLRDESIVYNSLYTIYNRSAALSVEKVH